MRGFDCARHARRGLPADNVGGMGTRRNHLRHAKVSRQGCEPRDAAMFEFRSVVKFLATFGAGVVVAGFFLSRPVERPPEVQPQVQLQVQPQVQPQLQPQAQPHVQPQAVPAAPAPASSAPAVAPSAPTATDPANMLSPRSVRTIPIERPPGADATTGGPTSEAGQRVAPVAPGQNQEASAPPQDQAAPAAAANAFACDYQACSRKYRSFDSKTCTYKPYGRGRRELCDR